MERVLDCGVAYVSVKIKSMNIANLYDHLTGATGMVELTALLPKEENYQTSLYFFHCILLNTTFQG